MAEGRYVKPLVCSLQRNTKYHCMCFLQLAPHSLASPSINTQWCNWETLLEKRPMDCHLSVHKVIAKQACNPHLQSQSITKIQTEGNKVKKVTHLLILFTQSWSFFHKLIHASCICPALRINLYNKDILYRFLWCTKQVFANTLKAVVKGMSEVK